VEGGQRNAIFHSLDHFVGDEHRRCEFFAAVNHPVSHRSDLTHVLDDAVFGGNQQVQHGLDGLGVGRHGDIGVVSVLIAGLMFDMTVNADTLTQPPGQDLLRSRIQQLILQ
jgi:hypothetical protein